MPFFQTVKKGKPPFSSNNGWTLFFSRATAPSAGRKRTVYSNLWAQTVLIVYEKHVTEVINGFVYMNYAARQT